eukprot:gnl/MRDRNA2_/MRDRNA2_52559_c0_seq1.p1 gnl/MRDRNA2_/MRDRNA2_52559_c0~~gnl/MRDRNA2_/MRDRNA2_52559_c0_seq1.p1  ORF type:complete len:433 (+),score=58.47 gnl/MRDRNA2_/MRDRNA2_52559_c0_seq1:156-1454(+)
MASESRWPPNLTHGLTSINHLEGASSFDTSEYLREYLGSERFAKVQQFHDVIPEHFIGDVQPDIVTCLRFLEAEKWNEARALARLKATVEWRSAVGADNFLTCPPHGATSQRYYCARICMSVGHDREGNIVLFDRMGPLFASGSVLAFSIEDWFLLYAWNLERWLQEMKWLSVKFKRPIWKYTFIADAAGAGMNVLSHRRLITYVDKLASAHYPELIEKIVLINAPRIFTAVWRVICTIMDPETTSKVEIYSDVPTARLLELIDQDQLPCELGGKNGIFIPPQCAYEHLPPLHSSASLSIEHASSMRNSQQMLHQADQGFSFGTPGKASNKLSLLDSRPTLISGFVCLLLFSFATKPSVDLASTGVAMGLLSVAVITKRYFLGGASGQDFTKMPGDVDLTFNHGSHSVSGATRNEYSDDAAQSSIFACCCSR